MTQSDEWASAYAEIRALIRGRDDLPAIAPTSWRDRAVVAHRLVDALAEALRRPLDLATRSALRAALDRAVSLGATACAPTLPREAS